jgi:hypothetical protein
LFPFPTCLPFCCRVRALQVGQSLPACRLRDVSWRPSQKDKTRTHRAAREGTRARCKEASKRAPSRCCLLGWRRSPPVPLPAPLGTRGAEGSDALALRGRWEGKGAAKRWRNACTISASVLLTA